MDKLTKKTLFSFAVFVFGTAVVILLLFFTTKNNVSSITSGNTSSNLANGGYVLEKSGFLFYTQPTKEGVYRADLKTGKNLVLISKSGTGYLQAYDDKIFFCEGEKLVQCKLDGTEKKTIVSFAKYPIVKGGVVFYVDNDGLLYKRSVNGGETFTMNIRPNGKFFIYMFFVYYTGEDGKLYSSRIDKNETVLLVDKKVDEFVLDGSHLFVLSGGTLYSTKPAKNESLLKIVNTSMFTVINENLAFLSKDGLFSKNLDKNIADIKLTSFACYGIGTDKTYFYYFDEKGTLFRIKPDGKELYQFK